MFATRSGRPLTGPIPRPTASPASAATAEFRFIRRAYMTTGWSCDLRSPSPVWRKLPLCPSTCFQDLTAVHRAFQLITIMSEISNALDNDDTSENKTVNLHVSRAISDIQSFIPGVSASILAFVVFGTTKTFREYFYRRLLPRRLRRELRRRSDKGASIIGVRARAASRGPRRPPRSDSTMYPPAPVATTRPFGAAWYQPTSPSPRVECFELDGGESGMGHGTRGIAGIHELPMPTPTYSTFEGQKQGEEDDDQRPILSSKPLR